MKHAFTLALIVWMGFISNSFAEDTAPAPTDLSETNSEDPAQALQDLCKSYVQDGTITAGEYNNCISSMTDLSESMPEPLPFTGDETPAPATEETANTPSNSEALVSDEIVEKPDPKAEQLNIN